MSAFTALNVEPDEGPIEDVDNTREIQIEEALKLYQTALKLHGQGPEFYSQAATAYEVLFNSEVFKFPESITEYERLEIHPESEAEFALGLGLDMALAQGSDSSSSLPQILYLAYKNHGLFIMDCLKHRIRTGGPITYSEFKPQAQLALNQLIKALARDESDTELWRRAAFVGSALGSQRLARYCLEAAVEVDDDPTQREVEPSTLEEGFAGALLKEQLTVLSDDVALSHPIMTPYRTNKMSGRLKKYMDPYPSLQDLPTCEETPSRSSVRLDVEVSDRSWYAVGESLLHACLTNQGSFQAKLHVPQVDEQMGDAEPVSVATTVPEMAPVKVMDDQSQVAELSDSNDNNVGSAADPMSIDSAAENADVAQIPDDVLQADVQEQHDQENANRKRSQSAAGLRDTVEDEAVAQKRSKRIRNRDTIGTEGLPIDPGAVFLERLLEFTQADSNMFTFINTLLVKLELPTLGTIDALQKASEASSTAPGLSMRNTLVRDIREILQHWNEAKAAAYISGTAADLLEPSTGGPAVGLIAFLEHLKTGPSKVGAETPFSSDGGLDDFLQFVNNGWMPMQDIICEYFKALQDSYVNSTWPETLKFNMVQLMVQCDAELYDYVSLALEASALGRLSQAEVEKLEHLGQMLFELHLDLYMSITNPGSRVDAITRVKENDRLARWSIIATNLIRSRNQHLNDELTLRYLWSTAFFVSLVQGTVRDHVISLWHDMKRILREAGSPTIALQNNAAIAEISEAAADREISKLTSTDFFLSLFQSDQADPIVVIETLEPVLIPQSNPKKTDNENNLDAKDDSCTTTEAHPEVSAELRNMWKFLEGGSAALRLFLWQRLREAYQNIDYNTKVFSCYLKSIEVIIDDLMTPKFNEHPAATRQNNILSWLKTIDDLLVKALTLALNMPKAFEVIDLDHIRSTCAALIELCLWLHSTAMFDDRVRIGAVILPHKLISNNSGPWVALWTRLREMQIRVWALLYTVLKDGMSQRKEIFPAIDSDLADYLSVVHLQLGLRSYCRISNKIFLKMMKVEMLRFKHVERWDDYLGQVLYDLYGIKLGSGVYVLGEHGVPVEPLDKRTAVSISEKVIGLANLMSVKDLLKSELRPTIEKMQQVIGAAKNTTSMQHNLRNINKWLKGSINPQDILKAMRGQLFIDTLPVRSSEARSSEMTLASNGWYFLLGMLALTKFKSQKRLVPGAATDDLRFALSFLRLQLQFVPEHWEAWYRLAQCYDAELEESVLFSADKLNSATDRKDITLYQRQAIRCYTMAYSCAIRTTAKNFDTASKISDMYHDFGVRIYSSTREPFAMEAFFLDDFHRHFSGVHGMYKNHPHPELQRSVGWRIAAVMFERVGAEKPDSWFNWYMLGKCRWKLYSKCDPNDKKMMAKRPTLQRVLSAFEKAIETCPKSLTSKEPVLEPHFKYMSIMHKLVLREDMSCQEAADKLQRQHYAINKGARVVVNNFDEWRVFILETIRFIQHADKSNWHHRLIFRVARIIYGEWNNDLHSAREAYSSLMKTMFTKTMVINVWKPEFERPGRHCVYAEIYIRYMVSLLVSLEEKENIAQLCRRVRRRQGDIYHFLEVWTQCVEGYLELLRLAAGTEISTEVKDDILALPTEEFHPVADALKKHCDANPGALPRYAPLMKEVEELKRLNLEKNVGLIKPIALDDLIIDLYCNIFRDIGQKLEHLLPPSLPVAAIAPEAAPISAPEQRLQGPMSIHSMLGIADPPNAPALTLAIPPVVKSSEVLAADLVPKLRTKLVSRRDILKRAEALISKIVTEPVKLTGKTKSAQPKDTSIGATAENADGMEGVVEETSAQTQQGFNQEDEEEAQSPTNADETVLDDGDKDIDEDEDNEDDGPEGPEDAQDETINENAGEGEEENIDGDESERGSVHDSADDESDLSDAPEEDVDVSVLDRSDRKESSGLGWNAQGSGSG